MSAGTWSKPLSVLFNPRARRPEERARFARARLIQDELGRRETFSPGAKKSVIKFIEGLSHSGLTVRSEAKTLADQDIEGGWRLDQQGFTSFEEAYNLQIQLNVPRNTGCTTYVILLVSTHEAHTPEELQQALLFATNSSTQAACLTLDKYLVTTKEAFRNLETLRPKYIAAHNQLRLDRATYEEAKKMHDDLKREDERVQSVGLRKHTSTQIYLEHHADAVRLEPLKRRMLWAEGRFAAAENSVRIVNAEIERDLGNSHCGRLETVEGFVKLVHIQ
ncbi:hypothetical protein T439DRAFT_357411 [Meredithblackwellia eburnea MCA 4105]